MFRHDVKAVASERNEVARKTLLLMVIGLSIAFLAFAYVPLVHAAQGTITLEVGKGIAIKVPDQTEAVFVADEMTANVESPASGQFFLYGRQVGSTTVTVTDIGGNVIWTRDVLVLHDLTQARYALKSRFPDLDLKLKSAEGTLHVAGTVPDQKTSRDVMETLKPLIGTDKIINNISVGTPGKVRLYVRLLEVQRTEDNNTGVNWQVLFGLDAQDSNNNFIDLNASIDFMINRGIVTAINEPSLAANSGESASFAIGGEIAFPGKPVIGPDGALITGGLEYRFIGTQLKFTPVVDGRDAIKLGIEANIANARPKISKVDGNAFPELDSRKFTTSLSLRHGQSFVLGGLSQSDVANELARLPSGKRIPVLSWLFDEDQVKGRQHELIVVVTPYLNGEGEYVEAAASNIRPISNIEFILAGKKGQELPDNLRFVGPAEFTY